ncbi:hypothetical protein FD755_016015, partial [Muntiacus reevesi]
RKAFLSLLAIHGTLHSNGHIFPFLLCFSLFLFSQLFVRPPQTAILPFCISFSWGCSSDTLSTRSRGPPPSQVPNPTGEQKELSKSELPSPPSPPSLSFPTSRAHLRQAPGLAAAPISAPLKLSCLSASPIRSALAPSGLSCVEKPCPPQPFHFLSSSKGPLVPFLWHMEDGSSQLYWVGIWALWSPAPPRSLRPLYTGGSRAVSEEGLHCVPHRSSSGSKDKEVPHPGEPKRNLTSEGAFRSPDADSERSSAQSSDGNMGLEAMGSPAEDLVGADISSGKGGPCSPAGFTPLLDDQEVPSANSQPCKPAPATISSDAISASAVLANRKSNSLADLEDMKANPKGTLVVFEEKNVVTKEGETWQGRPGVLQDDQGDPVVPTQQCTDPSTSEQTSPRNPEQRLEVDSPANSSTLKKLRSRHPIPSLPMKLKDICSLEEKVRTLCHKDLDFLQRKKSQEDFFLNSDTLFCQQSLSSLGYGFSSGHVWM